MLLSIEIFAVGAGLISGFFSVNENKDILRSLKILIKSGGIKQNE